jgi:glycerol kinase
MKLFLALDQSTSATKALLFDTRGRVIDREAREHAQHYPRPGWVEHDADEIWRNAIDVLRTLVTRHSHRAGDIQALSIANQRETIVVFDRQSGRPLHRALVWQDRRGDELCAEHIAAGREESVHRKTGLRIDGYFSGSKLQWLGRHEPGLRAKLEAGSAVIGTLDTFLIHRLTGGNVFATDTTNASRTLLFDITQLAWDEALSDLWEVPRAALPEVRDSTARFGETTLDGALKKPLPICGVMGDSHASLFAHRCFTPGTAKATFGTGSSLLLNIGDRPRFSSEGVLTALAWTHAGKPTYAFEGIIIAAASTLTWLRDQLGLAPDVATLEKLAQSVPDNGGVYLVPAFTGLGLPHWRPDACAAILGLTSHSDRRHIARAAFESIGYQIRDALDAMRAEAGLELAALHADGGPTASRFLMQFCSDLAGVELRVAAVADCSPLGAMLAGQLGLGIHSSLETLANAPRDELIYRPTGSPERIQSDYAGWHGAVAQVLSAPARLDAVLT